MRYKSVLLPGMEGAVIQRRSQPVEMAPMPDLLVKTGNQKSCADHRQQTHKYEKHKISIPRYDFVLIPRYAGRRNLSYTSRLVTLNSQT
jgi:hypothetical protein